MYATRKDMIANYLKRLPPNSSSPLNQVNDAIRLMNRDQSKNKTETKRSEPMCDQGTQEAVTTVVKELIKQRVSFTGYDVYTRMHNKLIRRGVDYTGNQEPPKSISTFVRQLFNSGDPAFTGYGSTIIPGVNGQVGPVMYFALPFSAKIRAKAIAANMSNNAATITP